MGSREWNASWRNHLSNNDSSYGDRLQRRQLHPEDLELLISPCFSIVLSRLERDCHLPETHGLLSEVDWISTVPDASSEKFGGSGFDCVRVSSRSTTINVVAVLNVTFMHDCRSRSGAVYSSLSLTLSDELVGKKIRSRWASYFTHKKDPSLFRIDI